MWLIAMSFATYRVTRFLIADTLIDRPRLWFHQTITQRGGGFGRWLFKLVTCVYCLSIWVAAAVTALVDLWGSVPQPVLVWLAVAAGALAVWKYIED